MGVKGQREAKEPVLRSISMPNGTKIVTLRESTLRDAVRAANSALRVERSGSAGHSERSKSK
jgi:hypothetical protein